MSLDPLSRMRRDQEIERAREAQALRDRFAMAAMQGLLACHIQPQSDPDMYARDAYVIADAMMEARKK